MRESAGVAGFDPFWNHATTVWEHAAARQRLLRWQDDYDVDVILALFALWYPHPVAATGWDVLARNTRDWNTAATRRIRSLRRRLKHTAPPELYHSLLQLELTAERIAALRLLTRARALTPPPRASSAAPDPAARLARLFPVLPQPEIREAVIELAPHHS